MKYCSLIPIILLTILLNSCDSNASEINLYEIRSYEYQIEETGSSDLLSNIQAKIKKAFVQDLFNNSYEKQKEINFKLDSLYKNKKQNLIIYWQAYLQFYTSIYFSQQNNDQQAEQEISKGIFLIKNIQHKNSEDYALLAMLEGISIQYKGISAAMVSQSMKQNLRRSIAIDSNNSRAYYVAGCNNFYTPEEFGGGKKVEENLLKSLKLPIQQLKNQFLPSWGKEEAFEILIKHYIKINDWEKAKKTFQEGLRLFPNSFLITQLASKLYNHQ